jgi:cell division protein FtsZ
MRVSIVATALDGQKPESKTVLNMVTRIQNRNNGYSDGLFSQNTKVENTTFNSIEGATALKLDEKFEINEQEQNLLINNIESSISEPKNEKAFESEDNIPNGVSIESASYMENSNNSLSISEEENKSHDVGANSNIEEEHTPKLFSDDGYSKTENDLEANHEIHSEKLFDQDTNDEEDFEIPAFLRKQKF